MSSTEPQNFLTTLSDDILSKLMRNVDDSEGEDDRHALISLFFDENSPFVSACGQMFSMIRLVSDGSMSCNLQGSLIQFNCGADELQLASRVLQVCGKHIGIIELSSVIRHQVESYASLISTHCTETRELRVRGADGCVRFSTAVNDVVGVLSSRLETLQFLEYRRRRVFSSRVAARLGGNCRQLRSFTYRGNELQRLTHLWRVVGANLEDLNLRSVDNTQWVQVFDAVGYHCRNLKSIMLHQPLHDDEVTDEIMAKFYASYGHQLERAILPSLDEESCTLIANSCRNLRCSFFEYKHQFGRFAALGERIEKLALTLEEIGDWTPLSKAMMNCSGLVTLEVGGSFRNPLGSDVWHNLFSSKLMYLENLILPTVSEGGEVLKKMAKNTSRLRSVCIAFESIENGTIFKQFGEANAHLEEVILSEMGVHASRTTSENVLDVAKDTFSCFESCAKMKRFSLELKSNAPDFGLLNNLFVRQRIHPLKLRFEFLENEWCQN